MTRGEEMRAYVGLGANLGERRQTIDAAVAALGALPDVELVSVSPLRETAPVGVVDQPPFLNGACAVDTAIGARELLKAMLGIEQELGRVRSGTRWGPRVIDLDLLLYGAQVIDEPGLTVPHPRLHERAFALEPLLDLDPDLTLPDGRKVKLLLSAIK